MDVVVEGTPESRLSSGLRFTACRRKSSWIWFSIEVDTSSLEWIDVLGGVRSPHTRPFQGAPNPFGLEFLFIPSSPFFRPALFIISRIPARQNFLRNKGVCCCACLSIRSGLARLPCLEVHLEEFLMKDSHVLFSAFQEDNASLRKDVRSQKWCTFHVTTKIRWQ